MSTAFITHPIFRQHVMQDGHPECPRRLSLIEDQLQAEGIADFLRHYQAPMASRAQLERVHQPAYLDALAAASPSEGLVQVDPDTAMCPNTLHAALHAAGAVVQAVDLVMSGEVENAFCCVRPPGHHAESAAAMGFCFLNNVSVGAAHAIAEHGLSRVAILDFDAHHGNGIEDIFADEPRVLVCSTYQHPLYPFSGAPTVSGHIINVPLAAGTRGQDYRAAISQHWLPELDRFRPQLIMVSAGFDGHAEDSATDLLLNDRDFEWLTLQIMDLAARHAGKRLISCLEGGYAAGALERCVALHLRTLAGI
ncbi:MAG: histone deacetylase family protein [Gammaproteobacteria bacterium]